MKDNQGKYHLVSIFLIPAVLVGYFLGGITIGIIVTVISALIIVIVFRKN